MKEKLATLSKKGTVPFFTMGTVPFKENTTVMLNLVQHLRFIGLRP